jgi:hypothetical protein
LQLQFGDKGRVGFYGMERSGSDLAQAGAKASVVCAHIDNTKTWPKPSRQEGMAGDSATDRDKRADPESLRRVSHS